MRPGVSKKELIKSLEQTLRLTRAGVVGLELVDEDNVEITFRGGGKRLVNIEADSGIAIIRDVTKAVD